MRDVARLPAAVPFANMWRPMESHGIVGPATSDSRPEAERRIDAICIMRSRACMSPSACPVELGRGTNLRYPAGVDTYLHPSR
jgi:hypothetical protein